MGEPSTDWAEKVGADEAGRFAGYGKIIAAMQRNRSAKYGTGRALHRKGTLAARASFEVMPDLPAFARHGLFATPGRHDARVRLSNGGPDLKANAKPDIRGFAIKVLGVSGPSSLGGDTDHQDFLTINQDSFASPTSVEFMGAVEALGRGGEPALIWHLFRTYGIGGGFARLKTLMSVLQRPFSGYATETFDTVLPIACGPCAARLRLVPASGAPSCPKGTDIVDHLRGLLAAGDLRWDVRLRFFVDEKTTPIEDATVAWPADAPETTVARLTLPRQTFDDAAAQDFAAMIDKARFDPWGGLEAHRPLGEIMRARKAAYLASQQGRDAT